MHNKEGSPVGGPPLPEIKGIALDPVALHVEDEALSEWRFEDALRQLVTVESATPWWLGDLLAFGERTWRETYKDIAARANVEAKTIKNRVWVSKAIQPQDRVAGLSWAVHREVAKLPADEQSIWLERAKAGGWSAETLRDEIKKAEGAQPKPKPKPLATATPLLTEAIADVPGAYFAEATAILQDERLAVVDDEGGVCGITARGLVVLHALIEAAKGKVVRDEAVLEAVAA